ncbi:MAG: UDP-N-acetylmuramate--L-alanine ligase [Candidatus Paceibacterota bacterium]
MLDFSKIKKIHFIGIGGSGMIPLVNLVKEKEKNLKISGSDIKDFPLRKNLEKRGVQIFLNHKKENINTSNLVVYSTAIEKNNIERQEAEKRKILTLHRFEFLKEILKEKKIIAISGSHGKSTTSTMIGYLLLKNNFSPTVYVGAKSKIFPYGSHWGKGEYAVIETDEHDASFLKILPYYSVILNIDNDHLDLYGPFKGDFYQLKNAFKIFAQKTQKNCILNLDDKYLKNFLKEKKLKEKIITYSLKNSRADLFIKNLKTFPFSQKRNYLTSAELYLKKKKYRLKLKIPSEINVSNTLAVLTLASLLNIKANKALKTLSNFPAIKRRFEIYHFKKVIIVDDYAHHPTEIKNSLKIARNLFPNKRVILVFEPHRFSRIAVLYKDFAKTLKNCDYLFLLEIDSANEKNYYGISSEKILKEILKKKYLSPLKIKLSSYQFLEKEILKILRKNDVLIFMGPGKIGSFASLFIKKYTHLFN